MDLKRRFIFHGHAVAIGGRIVRPDDVMLDPKCASALTVSGGRTSSTLKATRFNKYVRLASAETLAEGVFDKPKQIFEFRDKPVRETELTSTTTVRVDVQGLVVGVDGRLTVKRLRGSLTAKSPAAADAETAITLGKDTAIDGVTVGDHRLMIEINKPLFQENTTFSQMKRAAADLVEVRGTIYGSIVREIRWRGKPYPGARIDGHSVHVPDFGWMYFGEILIRNDSRRITLMRLELGSQQGGGCSAGDYQDNGGWGG
jgi:hypothetical protein